MSRFFTVNGKRYQAKPFDFNTICNLEDNGVPLSDMQKKPMSMVRAYFAECFNGDKDKAGEELQAHVVAGGKFDEIYNAMGEEMNDSDFFQALNKKEEQDTQKVESEKEKKAK